MNTLAEIPNIKEPKITSSMTAISYDMLFLAKRTATKKIGFFLNVLSVFQKDLQRDSTLYHYTTRRFETMTIRLW